MQERAEETRRAVLQAAAHLFFERGYAGTSIADISARSGRTSGAIYFHYAGKEQLALAVVEAHFAAWPALVARHESVAGPALERLVRLSFSVARAFRDDVVVRAGARLWAERRSIDVEMPPPFVDWIAAVERMLVAARDEGGLAPGAEPGRDAPTLVAAFFGLHTLSDVLDGRLLIEDRLTALWLLLLPGLQAAPAPRELLARVSAPVPASQ
ncbi:ScbR family autoregulator-binding transcription factor [Streptomyces sp. NPDC088337]|uniref:ScbR family autoregulator-binding transcription factor n=1 Tax=unclassified Streptomyces TaxID=2593676 RepID=UPI002DD92840|nr:ScbR family autoregulator-binding transcription factor [Streptomyces sp. NBC_01788]WSB29589.1 TetR/AcrR family transcriptional regulator [Streptomyces sp. NBC_01788]